jgi:cell shape-determining protein MreD
MLCYLQLLYRHSNSHGIGARILGITLEVLMGIMIGPHAMNIVFQVFLVSMYQEVLAVRFWPWQTAE